MIPLVWLSYHDHVDGRAQWDGGRGILGDLFRGQYGPVPLFVEHSSPDPAHVDPAPLAVVAVPGQHHTSRADIDRLNGDLARFGRVVVVVHGDEASLFPWQQVHHPDLTWWIMTPTRAKHGAMPTATRFFGEGPGPHVSVPTVERDLDVAFMGQVTHPRRYDLAKTMRRLPPDRTLFEDTGGFLQGRPHAGYMAQLARTKVAPCPAGVTSVDSFRLYQAVKAGCVPVVDRYDSAGVDAGMWDLVYPDGLPFPVVDTWAELPELLPWLLADHARLSASARAWWQARRADLARWLTADCQA